MVYTFVIQNGLVIFAVQIYSGVIGMNLDSVKSIFYDGLTDSIHRFGRSISSINVRKGVEFAGIAVLHLIKVSARRKNPSFRIPIPFSTRR